MNIDLLKILSHHLLHHQILPFKVSSQIFSCHDHMLPTTNILHTNFDSLLVDYVKGENFIGNHPIAICILDFSSKNTVRIFDGLNVHSTLEKETLLTLPLQFIEQNFREINFHHIY